MSINNWNEGRKAKIEEIKVLTSIKKALLSDIDNQFSLNLEKARTYKRRTNSIMTNMNNRLLYSDSLRYDYYVLTTGGSLNWTPQLTAYKRLESRGIDIIKNDLLLEAILDIYNLDYPLMQVTFENYKRNIHDYGRPLARIKFKSTQGHGLLPLNYELLFDDIELYNTISILNENSKEMEERLLKAKSNVKKVLKMIEIELNKRK